MMRLRIASVVVAAGLAFGAIAVPAASAFSSNGNNGSQAASYNFPALYSVPVSGQTANGNKQFKGTFGIQRFVAGHNQAWAVGTLKGKLGNRHVTRYDVKMPATLQQPSSGSSSSSARTAATCPILNLVLGPIHLDLLGLVVNLGGGTGANQPITLNITAVSGAGNLLGNLLCDVSNLLNQGGLSTLTSDIQALTGVLNGILGDLSLAGL